MPVKSVQPLVCYLVSMCPLVHLVVSVWPVVYLVIYVKFVAYPVAPCGWLTRSLFISAPVLPLVYLMVSIGPWDFLCLSSGLRPAPSSSGGLSKDPGLADGSVVAPCGPCCPC